MLREQEKDRKRNPVALIKETEWRRLVDLTKEERGTILKAWCVVFTLYFDLFILFSGFLGISSAVTISVPASFGQIIDIASGASDMFTLSTLLPLMGAFGRCFLQFQLFL
jgi:hypothetical protein